MNKINKKILVLLVVFAMGFVPGFFVRGKIITSEKPKYKMVYENEYTYMETPILEYEILDDWRYYIVTTNNEKQFYYFSVKENGGATWFERITN